MDSFGHHFILDIFGASHAPNVGVTLRGIPAELPLSPDDFTADILRRKSGAKGTTPRIEADLPELADRRASDGTLTITFAKTLPTFPAPGTPISWPWPNTARCATAGSPAA